MDELGGRRARRRVALWGGMVAVCLVGQPAAAFRNVEEGKAVPGFSLPSPQGEAASLEDSAGKAVALVFVRQGQEKSAAALRDLSALGEEFGDECARLAIVVNPEEGDAAAWARAAGDGVSVVLDRGGEAYGAYGVVVTPATGVVGPDGALVGVVNGHPSSYRDDVTRLVAQALGREVSGGAGEGSGAAGAPVSEARKAAERYLEKSKLLSKRRMKDKAVAAARQAVEADPDYAEARVALGSLLLDESDDNAGEARAQFEKALALSPRLTEARVGLARVKSVQGEHAEAVAILEEAAQLSPHPERLYYEVGLAHERAGEYRKAVEAYRKALDRLLKR
ncbi:MAG: hypothetical protein Kow0092_10100 [Deferrisomatales bacterium]